MPELSPNLGAVIDRALAFDEADRWLDAQAMREQLIAVRDGEADETPPGSLPHETADESAGSMDDDTAGSGGDESADSVDDGSTDSADESAGSGGDESADSAEDELAGSADTESADPVVAATPEIAPANKRRVPLLIAAAVGLVGAGVAAGPLLGLAPTNTEASAPPPASAPKDAQTTTLAVSTVDPGTPAPSTSTFPSSGEPDSPAGEPVSSTKNPPAAPRGKTPPSPRAPRFNMRQAQRATKSAAVRAQAGCGGLGPRGQVVSVSLTWRTSGQVANVNAPGTVASMASCVKAQMFSATIPPFSGPSGVVGDRVVGTGSRGSDLP